MIARRVYRPRPKMPIGSGAKGNAVYARRDYSQRWDQPAHGQITAALPGTGQKQGVTRGPDAEVFRLRPSS